MYVLYNIGHIHHLLNKPRKWIFVYNGNTMTEDVYKCYHFFLKKNYNFFPLLWMNSAQKHFFFTKIKRYSFIHSNRWITSFNTAKNVKDESANILTTSKLIACNGIMPAKIYMIK